MGCQIGVDGYHQPAVPVGGAETPQPAVDLGDHRILGGDAPQPFARGAHLAHRVQQRQAHSLTGHFQQTEFGDGRHGYLGPVVFELLDQIIVDFLAVSRLVHIDEVDNDQAPDVPQAQLAGHLPGGLQIDLEGILLVVPFTDEAPAVHVHHHHGLGLLHDQVAAALEPHLALQ